MARNTTPYHPELATIEDAVSHLIRNDATCNAIWKSHVDSKGNDRWWEWWPAAVQRMLLTLAYQRDEARRELESMVQDRLADQRRERAVQVIGEPTMTAVDAGEPTQVAR